jgi:hypothetical protein
MGQICQGDCWNICAFNRVQFAWVSTVKPIAVLHVPYSRDLSDLNVTFPAPTADWTPENGYPSNITADTIPRRAFGAGAHLGLTLVLDAEADEFYCTSSAGVGFKVKDVTSNLLAISIRVS